MKITTLAVSVLALIGSGCATDSSAPVIAMSGLPDCFASNYDAQRDLFTVKNTAQDIVNQQCMLTIGPRGGVTAPAGLSAGSYLVSLANGGGGGAGGTRQSGSRGGAGGLACVLAPYHMGGGPGWLGSPSNIVRIATGAVVAGTPGAESYARPSRAQHDRSAGLRDGHGGSGPGQTSGGQGGTSDSVTGHVVLAESGQDSRTTGAAGMGGSRGENASRWLAGGGGGPTSSGNGAGFDALAAAGFDAPTARIGRTGVVSGAGGIPGGNQDRMSAGGGGGGGGEGSSSECDAGARGGHGFIALRPI